MREIGILFPPTQFFLELLSIHCEIAIVIAQRYSSAMLQSDFQLLAQWTLLLVFWPTSSVASTLVSYGFAVFEYAEKATENAFGSCNVDFDVLSVIVLPRCPIHDWAASYLHICFYTSSS